MTDGLRNTYSRAVARYGLWLLCVVGACENGPTQREPASARAVLASKVKAGPPARSYDGGPDDLFAHLPAFCRSYGLGKDQYGEPRKYELWHSGTYVASGLFAVATPVAEPRTWKKQLRDISSFMIYTLRPDGSARGETMRPGEREELLINRIQTCWGVRAYGAIWFGAPSSEMSRVPIGIHYNDFTEQEIYEKVPAFDVPDPSCETRSSLVAPLAFAWIAGSSFAMVTFLPDGRVQLVDMVHAQDMHGIWAEFNGCWNDEDGKRVVRVVGLEGEQVVLRADDESIETSLGPGGVSYIKAIND